MFWFRAAYILALAIDLIWAIGLVTGILLMITSGGQQQAMVNDPTMNATLTSYVFILIFQFIMIGLCFFGFFNSYKIWRNKYMLDQKLRHLFIIWVCCWALCLLGTVAIAMYALIKGKDPQGQMGFMYEMFTKYAIDPKFVAAFERYQKDHSCCGLYSADDWLIVQLRASPGGGGGGGGGSFLGGGGMMDDGYQQNPSTGKCHIYQPLIPPGCGPMIMKDVNQKLGMYAGLTIVQVFLGIVAAVIAWYCFFYWLEKEVIVIPEDEVSNIVVIEPDESGDHLGNHYSNRHRDTRSSMGQQQYYGSNHVYHKHTGTHNSMDRSDLIAQGPMKFDPTSSNRYHHQHLSHQHISSLPLPPAMMTPSVQHFLHSPTSPVPLHHTSFIENSYSKRQSLGSGSTAQQHHAENAEAAIDKQLKTLGGTVLVKMHVDHKQDDAPADDNTQAKKPKKPTLAIVRNKHKKDPPPDPPPGQHGQTGNLAVDIAAMSGGKKVLNKIEDLVISDHPEALQKPPEPEILGSISGVGADSALNNLLHKGAATKAKEKELAKKKQADVVKPIVVGTNVRLHGAGGSVLQDIAKKQEKIMNEGGGIEPHGIKTMKYIPLATNNTAHRDTLTRPTDIAYQFHAQPPATLGNLAVPNSFMHSSRHASDHDLNLGSSRIRESLLNASHSFGWDTKRHSVISPDYHGGSIFQHRESVYAPPAHGGHHHASIVEHRNSVYAPDHTHGHESTFHRRDSVYNPDHGHHHPSIFQPRESVYAPVNSHQHGSMLQHRDSLYAPDHGPQHHASIFQRRESVYVPEPEHVHHRPSMLQHRDSVRSPPHGHHDSDHGSIHGHHHANILYHRDSVYEPAHPSTAPEHHHRASIYITPHHEVPHPNAHRPSIYIKPKANHSGLSRIIKHHQDRRKRSRESREQSDLSSSIREDDHHHSHFGGTIVPHAHDTHSHSPSFEHQRHHSHSNSGLSGRRPKSFDAGHTNRHHSRNFGEMSRESRYLEAGHNHRRSTAQDRDEDMYNVNRSRSPRARRHSYEDDDYDYEPPPSRFSQQDRSRSRSDYGRRRNDDNARILFKNPRRLDDSD